MWEISYLSSVFKYFLFVFYLVTSMYLPTVIAQISLKIDFFTEVFNSGNILMGLGLILIVATIFAFIASKLKQPTLIAYIIAGLIIGPIGLGLITEPESINTLAELGVAFLLFSAGLELDFKKLKTAGNATLIAGIFQIFLSFAIGYIFGVYVLGFSSIIGVYCGLILAFSSTMLATKTLVDKAEVGTLHGRIIIGILLIQDVFAILALIFLTGIAGGDISFEGILSLLITKVFFLLIAAAIFIKIIFPLILEYAAKQKEILFLTALSTLFFFIGLSFVLDFSIGIGAFTAGITLAGFPYAIGIMAEMRSLRNFFATIFFVTLGMQLNPIIIYHMWPLALGLIIASVIIKPLLLSAEFLELGYGLSVASFVGLYLGQASEFGFILAQQGFANNLITQEMYSLLISVVVISMAITPYSLRLKRRVQKFTSKFELPSRMSRNVSHFKKDLGKKFEEHIIVIGSHRVGDKIAGYLKINKEKLLVIERDPEVVYRLKERKIHYIFGDAENEDILELANIDGAKMIVITIADPEASLFIVERAREKNDDALIIARAHRRSEALDLYSAGADWVVLPEMIGSNETVKQIERFLEQPESEIEIEKKQHIRELKRYIE